jgi:GntR family transcriptional regulator/MocR family aminotransferase
VDLHVSLTGRRDLAGQIYGQIRGRILSGELRSGQALPPSRELAAQLGVARTTVRLAYDRLAGEGFLESRVGAGTYVSVALDADTDRPRQPDAGALRPHPTWPPPQVPPGFIGARPTYDFRAGIPDLRLFPYEQWRRLLSRQLRPSSVGTTMYGEPAGHLGLRTAIARHIGLSRAVEAGPDDIVITTGIQQALDVIGRVMLARGDCVAVEDPGYPPPRQLFLTMGLRVVPVPVDEQGIVVEKIPADARLVYVSPSHQFPLGMAMSLARRLALLDWADRANAAIVEDDYDSEFRFDSRPLESLRSLDSRGRVLYVGTFSKSLLPGLRLGFLVAPPGLHEALVSAKYVTDWHSPLPTQAALAEFIDEGGFARHLRRMRGEYRARYELIHQILSREPEPWLRPLPSVAGLHLTALLPPGSPIDTLPLSEAAWEQAGLAVYPLSPAYLGKPELSGLLIGYGAMPVEQITDGLRRLRDFVP